MESGCNFAYFLLVTGVMMSALEMVDLMVDLVLFDKRYQIFCVPVFEKCGFDLLMLFSYLSYLLRVMFAFEVVDLVIYIFMVDQL